MTKLAALPTTGHANCNADVARFLREMADMVDAGSIGDIRQLMVITEAAGKLDTWVAGGPCDNARVVGLIEMAKIRFIDEI